MKLTFQSLNIRYVMVRPYINCNDFHQGRLSVKRTRDLKQSPLSDLSTQFALRHENSNKMSFFPKMSFCHGFSLHTMLQREIYLQIGMSDALSEGRFNWLVMVLQGDITKNRTEQDTWETVTLLRYRRDLSRTICVIYSPKRGQSLRGTIPITMA